MYRKERMFLIMTMDKKFEEMDKFIEGFDNILDEEYYEFFNKEMDSFNNLSEDEKAEAYDQLFTKAIINKKYCIRRTKGHLKSSIGMLDIIKKAIIGNASTDVILDTIEEMKSFMEDDFNEVEKKMRYCRK